MVQMPDKLSACLCISISSGLSESVLSSYMAKLAGAITRPIPNEATSFSIVQCGLAFTSRLLSWLIMILSFLRTTDCPLLLLLLHANKSTAVSDERTVFIWVWFGL